MPGRRVTLEQSRLKEILTEFAEPKFGKKGELLFQVFGVISNACFVAGCVCFFEENESPYLVAIWLFFGGSVLNVVLSSYALWEKRSSKSETDNISFEYCEHVLYVAAGIAFAVGSVLWLPAIYSDPLQEVYGHAAAAWCFIFGSLGLVIASIWNAIDLVEESTKCQMPNFYELTLRRLAGMALCCTAIGGALFVAGSFMFRPGFKNDCKLAPNEIPIGLTEHNFRPHQRRGSHTVFGPQVGAFRVNLHLQNPHKHSFYHPIDPLCVNIIKQGTWVYLWGSAIFFVQSIISLVCCILAQWSGNRVPKKICEKDDTRLRQHD